MTFKRSFCHLALFSSLLLAMPLCLSAQDDAPASLATNGNFENDTKGAGWPDDWGRPKSGGSWEQEGENRFVRLRAGEPGETVLMHRLVPIPDGVKALEVSVRARTTNVVRGSQPWFDARIMTNFKDADGHQMTPAPKPLVFSLNSGDWETKSVRFLVPEGAIQLELMPCLFQVESGTLDLDDIVIQAIDPEGVQARAPASRPVPTMARSARPLTPEGDLISNGDFETAAPDAAWPGDWGRPQTGGSWEEEAGSRFVRLQSGKPGETVLLYRLVPIPEGIEALEITTRARLSNFKRGKNPWFDARIMANFKDAQGKLVKPAPRALNFASDTEGWKTKSVRFLVPREAVTLELMPSLFQAERGTFDLDEIVIRPADPQPLHAEAELKKRLNIAPEPANPAKWPQELRVVGTELQTREGKVVQLQGVNVVSLEFLVMGENVLRTCQLAVEEWKANCIRLPVREDYWFGTGPGQKDGGAAYRKLVDDCINMVANRGAYVLLDLHRYRAPKEEHVVFWKEAAAQYKDHPAVLFDIFNEPHGISWEVWRNGGYVEEKKKDGDEDAFLSEEDKAKLRKGFHSPGMQALVNAIRGVGAKNIIAAGGLDWAYDLSGIANGYALDDAGGNGIMYSTHIYNWKRDWAGKVLVVADKYPIIVGETGADPNKMNFIPAEAQEDPYTWSPDLIGFVQKHKFQWTAFSFHPQCTPILILDWNYTPSPFWGRFVKDALAGKQFEMKKMR